MKKLFACQQVYKKVWLAENSESDAMRVVYRMRGLLGDATEEFVETLDKKKEEDVDNEQVYRMAGVMCQCGGLEVRSVLANIGIEASKIIKNLSLDHNKLFQALNAICLALSLA